MAFVGLVGLYACRVKRLKSEKRKPAHFIGFIGFIGLIASLLFFVGFSCAAWIVLCVLLVVFSLLGCVVGVSFSLWTKRKRSAFVLRSVFTRFWCLYFKLSNAIIASL